MQAIERRSAIQHMPPVGFKHCPHCDHQLIPELPLPFGAAKCRSCGRPLWYLTINGSLAFFRESDAKFVLQLFSAIPQH
jgi:hypothetical protein